MAESRAAGSGLVACQLDSYLRSLETVVVSCLESKIPESAEEDNSQGAGKKKKSKKKKKSQKFVTVYEVVLADTCLFPEGGGQPCDHGTVNGLAVTNVFRNSEGIAVHHCPEAIEPGTKVTVELDWERRFDHMQQHSSQHLITAIADQVFGFHTTSWGLLTDVTTIDLDCSVEELSSKVDELELLVNQKIREGIHLHAKEYPIEEARTLSDLRVGKKGLPEGLERMRIVRIDGLESNACCGTHVQSLAHLQMVKFCGVNKTSRGSLLSFQAGGRILRYLAEAQAREHSLNIALACGPPQYVAAVDRLKNDVKNHVAEQSKLVDELNERLTAELVQRATQDGGVAYLHRENGEGKQMSRLGSLALEAGSDSVRLLILTCGNSEAADGLGTFVVVGRDADEVKAVGAEIADSVGGRGGGRAGIFQGKASSVQKLKEAARTISEAKVIAK